MQFIVLLQSKGVYDDYVDLIYSYADVVTNKPSNLNEMIQVIDISLPVSHTYLPYKRDYLTPSIGHCFENLMSFAAKTTQLCCNQE